MNVKPELHPIFGFFVYAFGFMLLGNYRIFAEEDVRFNRDVRPILAEYCLACHGFDQAKREAGLRLDTHEGATATLDSTAIAVVPGKPDESELIKRIISDEHDSVMPPPESGKQLSEAQKKVLRQWVQNGAGFEKHWSFEPPAKPTIPTAAIPTVDSPATTQLHPIDFFIREKLASSSLSPSPTADATTLIRRLSFDLTGLPPTLAELDAFLVDYESNPVSAYTVLVDRLLGSAAYGEKWGRWWLDQARYADSNGYSVDAPRQIWKYRDWVIDAFNKDMPFDQFAIEQIAGDLLPDATLEQKVATGFHRNTPINQEGGIDEEQFRIDSVFDRVATTGTVFLGLTIGCAQCHDHKFDPILQREFYQFFAFFNNQDEPTLPIDPTAEEASKLKQQKSKLELAKTKIIEDTASEVTNWENELSDEQKANLPKYASKAIQIDPTKRTFDHREDLYVAEVGKDDKRYKDLIASIKKIDVRLSKGVTSLVLKEREKPRETYVFIQGDFTRPSDLVSPSTPSVLPSLPSGTATPNRLDLAKWLVSKDNPLTARVIVNRVWQQFFGRGIVETENDFGTQGAVPTHADLLDYLAVDWIDGGWSFKRLHRKIVMSQAYRQSSMERPELRDKDPNNYLLARQRRLRLEAELVRDAGLVACDLLTSHVGGPPVYPPIPPGVMELAQVKREWKESVGKDRYRRGMYTFVYRGNPHPSLNVFDAPEGITSCTRRIRSNTPLQALTLLNDKAFFEFANALAKIIDRDGIESAFRRCTSRIPSEDEKAVLTRLDSISAARVLLNLDETVTRE